MNSLLETKIKKIIEEEIKEIAYKVIERKTNEAREEISKKSHEIVSKITEYVLVNSFEDPTSLKTVVQIELNKVVILDKK